MKVYVDISKQCIIKTDDEDRTVFRGDENVDHIKVYFKEMPTQWYFTLGALLPNGRTIPQRLHDGNILTEEVDGTTYYYATFTLSKENGFTLMNGKTLFTLKIHHVNDSNVVIKEKTMGAIAVNVVDSTTEDENILILDGDTTEVVYNMKLAIENMQARLTNYENSFTSNQITARALLSILNDFSSYKVVFGHSYKEDEEDASTRKYYLMAVVNKEENSDVIFGIDKNGMLVADILKANTIVPEQNVPSQLGGAINVFDNGYIKNLKSVETINDVPIGDFATDAEVTAYNSQYIENNIVYINDIINVTSNGTWSYESITLPVEADTDYYLRIGKVSNNVDNLVVTYRALLSDGSTNYAVDMTKEQVLNGRYIVINTGNNIESIRIDLYAGAETDTSGLVVTFENVVVTKNSDRIVYKLNNDYISNEIIENNTVLNFKEKSVFSNGSWTADKIIIPVEENTDYYLKIDSVEGQDFTTVATLQGLSADYSPYYFVDYTMTQIENGETIGFNTGADIKFIQLQLYASREAPTYGVEVKYNNVSIFKNHNYRKIELSPNLTYWNGKKIVWFGTSIPAGSYDTSDAHRYPNIVGKMLGATIYNEAVGSSSIAIRNVHSITNDNPYGVGNDFEFYARCLTDNLEIKQWLIDNYQSSIFTANVPTAMDDYTINRIKGYSYEQKLDRYLKGGEVGEVDLYVFDHGYNDNFDTNHNYETLKEQYGEENLYSYIGGMNFLIKRILESNPKAKIVIVGHYSKNADAHSIEVVEHQKQIADMWSVDYIDIASKLGWSGRTITTTGYWNNGLWVESGGNAQTITIKDANVCDGIHPYTDASGKANNMIAQLLASYLKNNIL